MPQTGGTAPGNAPIKERVDAQGKTWVFEALVNGRGGDTTDSNQNGKMLASSNEPLRSILFRNNSNGTIYIGGPGVNSSNGHPVLANEVFIITPTDPGNRVRAADVYISGAGTSGLAFSWVGLA